MIETALDGARVIQRTPVSDERGFLERLWCDSDLAALLGPRRIRQINRTLTRREGAVRGLHYQRAPHAEMKIVHCLAGRVFDVAVDLRKGSATFGQWHGVELSGDAHHSFCIPEGFAHGFQTLSPDCEMLYFHTATYDAEAEAGLNPADPDLAIAWPLDISELSPRDRALPGLHESFHKL